MLPFFCIGFPQVRPVEFLPNTPHVVVAGLIVVAENARGHVDAVRPCAIEGNRSTRPIEARHKARRGTSGITGSGIGSIRKSFQFFRCRKSSPGNATGGVGGVPIHCDIGTDEDTGEVHSLDIPSGSPGRACIGVDVPLIPLAPHL